MPFLLTKHFSLDWTPNPARQGEDIEVHNGRALDSEMRRWQASYEVSGGGFLAVPGTVQQPVRRSWKTYEKNVGFMMSLCDLCGISMGFLIKD